MGRDPGGGAEIGRHAAAVSPRQPGQRLDPRGGDDLGRRAVLGGVQQSDPLQPARKAEPARIHRARTGRELEVERRLYTADLQAARRRQMARRQAVQRGRRQMHLGHAARQVAGQIAAQPAQGVVPQPRRCRDRGQRHGHLRDEAAAAGLHDAAGLGVRPGLSVPCAGRRDAKQADRHRTVQIRRIQAQRIHQVRQEPGLLEKGPARISTRSNGRSSRTARRRRSPLSPASST